MSDSQVRLQVATDRAAGKHIGDSRDRGKRGLGLIGHGDEPADDSATFVAGEVQDGEGAVVDCFAVDAVLRVEARCTQFVRDGPRSTGSALRRMGEQAAGSAASTPSLSYGLRRLIGLRRAVPVIDMQAVMIPVLWRGAELVERIGALVGAAHEVGLPVIAIQQTGPPSLSLRSHGPGLAGGPPVCASKTATRASVRARPTASSKPSWATSSERGITTVVVVGAATDFCVEATVRAAVCRGLDVALVGH